MTSKTKPEWLKGVVNGAPVALSVKPQIGSNEPIILDWHFENDGSGLREINSDDPPPEIPPMISVFMHASAENLGNGARAK